MPHSESQVIDLMKTTAFTVPNTILSTPRNGNEVTNHNNNSNNIKAVTNLLRPPLPPTKLKIVKKCDSLLNQTNETVSFKTIDGSTNLSLPSRSVTPINFDFSGFTPISRNSSCRSIGSTSTSIGIRSFSPSLSSTISRSSTFDSRKPLRSLTPRRIFPQTYTSSSTIDLNEIKSLDQASTVFDGKLSFVLGCQKQRVRQELRPSPAHSSEAETASRYLTEKINNFLKRTDHVMEEWNNHCKSTSTTNRHCDIVSMIEEQRNGDEMSKRLARSKSVTNIMIKGYQMAKSMPPTERSNSVCRDISQQSYDLRKRDDDEDTICDEEVLIAYDKFIQTKVYERKRDEEIEKVGKISAAKAITVSIHSINTENLFNVRLTQKHQTQNYTLLFFFLFLFVFFVIFSTLFGSFLFHPLQYCE